MSHFLDRLKYFSNRRESFAGGFGQINGEDRTWEDAYRNRWAHDKIVRSTHGVNCTGACSWKIFVKGGIVTWEIQQTDYPRTRWDMPNHEPRGCSRGASYSWYLYSANGSSTRWCAATAQELGAGAHAGPGEPGLDRKRRTRAIPAPGTRHGAERHSHETRGTSPPSSRADGRVPPRESDRTRPHDLRVSTTV